MPKAKSNKVDQHVEWKQLYKKICARLRPHGRNEATGKGDYWVVDDEYGAWCFVVIIYKKDCLSAELIEGLFEIACEYPRWRLSVGIAIREFSKDQQPNPVVVLNKFHCFSDLNEGSVPAGYGYLIDPERHLRR